MHQEIRPIDRALHNLIFGLGGVAVVLFITIIVLELKC